MKQLITMFVALIIIFILSSPTYAQLRKDMDYYRGKVVAVDVLKNEVTLQQGGENITLKVNGDVSGFKDKTVLIRTKPGSKTAHSIKLVKPRR